MRSRLPKGHLRKKGNNYWCQWKVKGKPYSESLHTSAKSDAEIAMQNLMVTIRHDIISGTFHKKFDNETENPLVVGGDIALASAWKAYLSAVNRPDAGDTTLHQYACQFGVFVRWMAQYHPEVEKISGLTKIIAREFASSISTTYSPNTFNKYINLLSLVFRTLYDTLDIEGDPWTNIRKKGKDVKGRKSFSDDEVATIMLKATDETFSLCLLGANTGFRLKDCCLLEWSEVDLEKRIISHVPFKTRRRRPNHVVKLHILDKLFDHLSALKKMADGKFVCPTMAANYLTKPSEVSRSIQEFFSDKCGFKIHYDETGYNGRKLVELGFHSFRHFFVTRAKEAGIPSDVIQEIVGWGSPEMERIYNHISDKKLTDAVKKLEPKPAVKEPSSTAPSVDGQSLANITDDELAKTCRAMLDEIERRRKAS